MVKDKKIHAAWSRNGRIIVKKNIDSFPTEVYCIEDAAEQHLSASKEQLL